MYSSTKLILVVSLILGTFILTVSSAIRRSSHGEGCDRMSRCNSKASLTCQDGYCQCILIETMSFDQSRKACAVIAGEKCVYTAVEIEDEAEEKMWREELACVSGAICRNGFCACETLFYENPNGTCEAKKLYNGTCTADFNCRQDLHLVCSQGRCECNATFSVYDDSKSECVSRAGSSCYDMVNCPMNARCLDPKILQHLYSDIYNSPGNDLLLLQSSALGQDRPPNVQCICDSGFFQTKRGTCSPKVAYGKECETSESCREDLKLVCYDGICQCNNTATSYDKDTNRCVSLADGLCNEGDYKPCVENSRCVHDKEIDRDGYSRWQSRCKCNSNYFKTFNGTCEFKHGYDEQCTSEIHCRNEGYLKLNCESGRCKCHEPNSFYDPSVNICRKLVGADCSENIECVAHSECINRQCTCEDGLFTSDRSGYCMVNFGMQCDDLGILSCNHEQGLVCRDEKCQCEFGDHQYFNETLQKCVSYVKGPCGNGSLTYCVPNSECTETKFDTWECLCKDGFVAVERQCDLAYGEPCAYGEFEPKCDRLGPLNCNNGICDCAEFQYYDQDTLSCRGYIGSKCSVDSKNFCTEGAVCKKFRGYSKNRSGRCQCDLGFNIKADRTCVAVGSLNDGQNTDANESTSSSEERHENSGPRPDSIQNDDVVVKEQEKEES